MLGLLLGLQDLWPMVNGSTVSAAVLMQAARAREDHELENALQGVANRNERQREWLLRRIRQAAADAGRAVLTED